MSQESPDGIEEEALGGELPQHPWACRRSEEGRQEELVLQSHSLTDRFGLVFTQGEDIIPSPVLPDFKYD